jgi:hypothetical protein
MKFVISLLITCCSLTVWSQSKPSVFIFTDIHIGKGDPDDRQSLVHLLWYADELDIIGIVPDQVHRQGVEACEMAFDAYEQDYMTYGFDQKGFPSASWIRDRLFYPESSAIEALKRAADIQDGPIYVLIWGNMNSFKKALFKYPSIAGKVRVITIGTGLKYGPKDEVAGEACDVPNWNGPGRNDIFDDKRFDNMWWLEINWTYNGMFMGDGPKVMFEELSKFGKMGTQIKEVTNGHEWAQYFRVGDTPSVTYLLDTDHDADNPETSSWAGLFKKPFPGTKPNYFTDDNGVIEWNYANPCDTWNNLKAMYTYNKSTLYEERQEMYDQLLRKLEFLYK